MGLMEVDQGRRRARCLLSSYYGVEGAGPADNMNIDISGFNPGHFVASLLQCTSLEELVQRGNVLVSEIKSLDSDMQMLVYENYNKFISATDTIRTMKHRVQVLLCAFLLIMPTPLNSIGTPAFCAAPLRHSRRSYEKILPWVWQRL